MILVPEATGRDRCTGDGGGSRAREDDDDPGDLITGEGMGSGTEGGMERRCLIGRPLHALAAIARVGFRVVAAADGSWTVAAALAGSWQRGVGRRHRRRAAITPCIRYE